jgi:hypothetical protein
VKATTELPDDPALAGLAAIRAVGVAGALPALGLDERPVEVLLRGYTPGSRATLEVRTGRRRLAVKAYAEDPAPEAELYRALAAAGLSAGSDGRAPPLLAWERDLRVLVVGWLEGPTANELVKAGRGKRAGELAAQWFRRVASLPVMLGPSRGAAHVLDRARHWIAQLGAADPALGRSAMVVGGMLALAPPTPGQPRPVRDALQTRTARLLRRAREWAAALRAADPGLRFATAALPQRATQTHPGESAPRLVHGSLYARHLLDLGDGPGVIDWQDFGQGPVEFDAGTFLATVWRIGLRDDRLAGEVARAERAFLAGVAGMVDTRALAWYRATALLMLARRLVHRRDGDWLARAQALLGEAVRSAEAGG